MHSFIPLSVLALAGSVLAAPIAEAAPVIVYETKVVTVMYTEGAAQPTPAPQQPQAQAYPTYGGGRPHFSRSRKSKSVVKTSTKAAAPTSSAAPPPPPPAAPTSTVVYQPPPPADTPTPVAPTSSAAPPAETAPASGDYMAVVDEWRQKLGMQKINKDAKMEANVLDCLKSSPGKMEHKLNSGSFGQVLAPGSLTDNFQHVYVGGWLCEVATTAGLDGICATESKGWDYHDAEGKLQTGHNEILVDPKYTKIGCAEFDGIVGCDFSYGDY